MEISEEQLCNFVESWIKLSNSNCMNKDDFTLQDTVHNCFENQRMFDSWFNGYDVMG